jgi:peptide/nickel transport system substrate-binding protein
MVQFSCSKEIFLVGKHFICRVLFFLMLLLFLFPMLVPSDAANTLTYVRPVSASTLEPGRAFDSYSNEVIINIFEGLVSSHLNPLTIKPCLAERWEVKDKGKKWLFFLRKGVRFHNGEIFDAAAVVKAFERRMTDNSPANKYWKSGFKYLSKVTIIDPLTVEFTIQESYFPFLALLSEPMAYIPAPSAYKHNTFSPVGTGPFKFKKQENNQVIVLSRNADYWHGPVSIDTLIFKTVANSSSRVMQIKNGSADVIKIYSLGERDVFLGKRGIHLQSALSLRVHYLAFNTRKPLFSKPGVRRAFAHLLDKRMLVKYIFQDLAIPAKNPLPPHFFDFNKKILDYPYDRKKAKQELINAGVTEGFDCSLIYTETNPALQKIVKVITANAAKIGITIKSIPLPFKQLIKRVEKGEHDMVILGWTGGPDPYLYLYPVFSNDPGNLNRSFYENDQLTRYLEKSRSIPSEQNRRMAIEKVQEILHRDSPWIPLFHLKHLVIYRSPIRNLHFDASGLIMFRDVVK